MPVRFDPVGYCIYCGAVSYSSARRRLAEEHIIPYGLNGSLVLPEASCGSCEHITGRDESILLRGMLLGIRTRFNLRTRKPKDRPKALPLFSRSGGKFMIAVEDYPYSIAMLRFGEPGVFSNTAQPIRGMQLSGPDLQFNKMDVVFRKYGLSEGYPPALDVVRLLRVLSKIGYAYAAAALGHGCFSSTIPRRLQDKNDELREYVGSIEELEEKKSDSLHEIGIERPSDAHNFIVVRLRLFAWFGMPTYRIVAGQHSCQSGVDLRSAPDNVFDTVNIEMPVVRG